MKIRCLDLEGIGPFISHHTVDFTRFDDGGLFLLHGPTGAGKSTILDCVSFALYGTVARQGDADNARLRSTLVNEKAPSRVSLVFETDAGIFRVTRTPQFTREGRKTAINQSAHLEKVRADESGTYVTVDALCSGVKDANIEITHLIGLNGVQYLQTAILPQGKFSQFLTASSEDRHALLSSIFQTSLFVNFETALKEKAKAARGSLEHEQQQVSSLIHSLPAQLWQALGDTDPDSTPPPSAQESGSDESQSTADLSAHDSPPITAAMLVELIGIDDAAIRTHLEDGQRILEHQAHDDLKRSHECADTAEELGKQLQAATDLARRVRERIELEKRASTLNAERQDIDAVRTQLARARQAAHVIPVLHRLDEARTRQVDARNALADAMAAARSAHVDPAYLSGLDTGESREPSLADDSEIAATVLTLTRAHDTLHARHIKISELAAVEAALPERREALQGQQSQLEQLNRQQELLRQRMRNDAEQLEALAASDERATTASIDLTAAQTRHEALDKRLDAARRAVTVAQKLEDTIREAEQAQARIDTVHDTIQQARRALLAQSALRIASTLESGKPCPVCGSTEHPSPAQAGEAGTVDPADIDQLHVQYQQEQDAFTQLSAQCASIRSTWDALGQQADGSVEDLTAALADEARTIDALKVALQAVQHDQKTAEKLRTQRTRDDESCRDLLRRSDRLTHDIETAQAALDTDEKRCTAARAHGDGEATLQDIDHDITVQIDAIDTLRQACENAIHARAAVDQALAEQADALERYGYAEGDGGTAQVRADMRTDVAISEMDARITAFDRDDAHVHNSLQSERLKDVDTSRSPDVDAAARSYKDAQSVSREAAQRAGASSQVAADVKKAVATVQEHLDTLVKNRDAFGPLDYLSQLASSGQLSADSPQTSLSHWVLGRRLDDVLACANPRIMTISNGRYELIRSDKDYSRNKAQGLGLTVLDHETDKVRSPKTLSGGETFYISLALALGLSDVVTTENGGIELRTMFIDEGFGSLDSSTLDTVMAQLASLHTSGRTIGVISHVADMTSRILDQIEVIPVASGGSTLRVRA